MDIKTKNRIISNMERVLSEILSDKYDAKITITLKKEVEEDVPRVQENTVRSEMSKCS